MTSLLELPQPLLDRQDALERALRKHVEQAARSELPLYRMMEYQLGWLESDGSEATGPPPLRFHGALCLEAASSVAAPGNGDAAGAAGAAAELMYQSTAVHEEMQIAEMRTEQRPAVWWVWGPAQAINVGDGLHAMARLAIFAMQEHGQTTERVLQAVGVLDAAALRYYEGQYMELTFQERVDITEAQYHKMALGKHGALVGGAMALGALAARASEGVVDAFRSFGEQLGSPCRSPTTFHSSGEETRRARGSGGCSTRRRPTPSSMRWSMRRSLRSGRSARSTSSA